MQVEEYLRERGAVVAEKGTSKVPTEIRKAKIICDEEAYISEPDLILFPRRGRISAEGRQSP
jgi:hypothetical protein